MRSLALVVWLGVSWVLVLSTQELLAGGQGLSRPGGIDESRILKEYLAEGQVVEGRLTEYSDLIPQKQFSSHADTTKLPVVLGNPGFPLPFSQPVVAVTVSEESDFTLVVRGGKDNEIDRFVFRDVEPGVFLFSFKQPVWPAEDCVVQLVLKGVVSGQKFSSTAVLNGLK